jgi:arginine/lysine/ornithine decarboxylase
VAAARAAGRIAAETLSPYPPGVPVLVPGERITAGAIGCLQAVAAAGGTVRGAVDGMATIAVVDA